MDVHTFEATGSARSRTRWRRLWLSVHLYLGLWLGALLSLLGITGSLLVFYVEMDRWLNPALQITVPADAEARPLQDMVTALQAAHPQRDGPWRLEMPTAPDQVVMVRYNDPVESKGKFFAPLLVALNPYTLEVVNSRFWGDFLMTWLLDLHMHLLLGTPGQVLLAISGMTGILSLVSGIWLWWPAPGRWAHALRPRWRRGSKRWVFDLHVQSGVYGLILLLVFMITGTVLARPAWFEPLITLSAPLTPTPAVTSNPGADVEPITLDAAVAVAQARYPAARVRWVETPSGPTGTYFVRLEQPGEPGQRFPQTRVWVDPYTTAILAVYDPAANTSADTLMHWMHPLHSGEAFGLTGRWLAFFSGWLFPLLFGTGLVRWWQKRQSRSLLAR